MGAAFRTPWHRARAAGAPPGHLSSRPGAAGSIQTSRQAAQVLWIASRRLQVDPDSQLSLPSALDGVQAVRMRSTTFGKLPAPSGLRPERPDGVHGAREASRAVRMASEASGRDPHPSGGLISHSDRLGSPWEESRARGKLQIASGSPARGRWCDRSFRRAVVTFAGPSERPDKASESPPRQRAPPATPEKALFPYIDRRTARGGRHPASPSAPGMAAPIAPTPTRHPEPSSAR
jgi:hypothetical protein